MAKKVLILSASPRKGGNSDLLCDQFAKGAEEAGHQVEKIRVQEKKIAPCLACYGCRNTGVCVQKDDMAAILDKLVEADVLVLATPVYFYSMDGQLKTLIDRTCPGTQRSGTRRSTSSPPPPRAVGPWSALWTPCGASPTVCPAPR